MSNLTKNKLAVATKPKQAIQVNKTFMVIIAGCLAFIFLLAIIMAFSTSTSENKIGKLAVGAKLQKTSAVNPAFNNLPENYHDINGIKKYLQSEPSGDYAALQKQFTSLKAEQEVLEEQLATMSQAKVPVRHVENPETLQAKSSGLFFVGGSAEQGVFPSSAPMGNVPGGPQGPQQVGQTAPTVGPVTPQQVNFYNEQSANSQKLAVAKAADSPEDIYDLHNVVTPVSPYEIQAGTIIPAALISAVNTTLAGTVVAQVRQNIYDTVVGKFLLVPKGSKLLGEYESRVSYGQRRVLITFNRIIRPDGSSILLGKPSGSDLQGNSGLEGDVDNHWMRVLGAATISTILSVGAGVASDHYQGSAYYPNARQNAILGGAGGVSQVGQSITNRALDVQPTITLPAGYQFNVIVKKDMVLTPYKRH